jgi:hypothetical protein
MEKKIDSSFQKLESKNNEKEINLRSEIIFGNKSDNLDSTEKFLNFINKKLINKIIKEFENNKQEQNGNLKENQNLLEFKEQNQLKINEINNRTYIEKIYPYPQVELKDKNILTSLIYSKIETILGENSLLNEEKTLGENSLNYDEIYEINQLIIKNNDLKIFLQEKSPLKFYIEYIGPKINFDYVIFYGEVYENSKKTENIIVFLKRDESIFNFNFYFYFILIFFFKKVKSTEYFLNKDLKFEEKIDILPFSTNYTNLTLENLIPKSSILQINTKKPQSKFYNRERYKKKIENYVETNLYYLKKKKPKSFPAKSLFLCGDMHGGKLRKIFY